MFARHDILTENDIMNHNLIVWNLGFFARGHDLNCVTLSLQFNDLMEGNTIEAGETDSDSIYRLSRQHH